ncbi:MAG: SpoIIE family protein phosphatase [Bacteroidales bacterium]|nr:SpoIIE family protein phosphatase [Bacteroidales bacterium]
MDKRFILILIELFWSLFVVAQNSYNIDRELIGLYKYDSIYQSISFENKTDNQIDYYLNMAEVTNNPDSALFFSFKAHHFLQQSFPNINTCRCFILMAKNFYKLKFYYASINAFLLSINHAKYLNLNNLLIDAYLGLAEVYMNIGVYSDMFYCYDNAILLKELNHNYNDAISINNKLAIFTFNNNYYKDSYYYYFKNIELASQLNDSILTAYSFSNIASNYIFQYREADSSVLNLKLNEAIKFSLLSNKILNTFSNKDSIVNNIHCKNYINLCKIYLYLSKYNQNNYLDSCLYYFNKYNKCNNNSTIIDNEILLILPSICLKNKQYLESLNYLQNIDTQSIYNDIYFMSKYYKLKSIILNKLEKYKESLNNTYKYDSLQVELTNQNLLKKEIEIKSQIDFNSKKLLINQFSFFNTQKSNSNYRRIQITTYGIFTILFLLLISFIIVSQILIKRKKNNKILNNKNIDLINQQSEIMSLRDNICFQKAEEEKLAKQIHDSIVYAERIQKAVISNESDLKILFPESFILYKPKEIVSGDFFIVENYGDFSFLILVDCLGHGVPGGFMVMLGISYLKDILVKSSIDISPSQIIESLGSFFINTIYKEADEYFLKKRDGMEMTVCKFYKNSYDVDFSTSCQYIYISRRGQVIVEKGDSRSVESIIKSDTETFTTKQITLFPNDMVYFVTNGLQNQKGGECGNCFSQPGLVEFFSQNDMLPVNIQKNNLMNELDYWMSSSIQTDDITLLGVRIL